MPATWTFYGRQDELGGLLAHMRRSQWFFGTIRGRRRIGKTALIQQAMTILGTDPSGLRSVAAAIRGRSVRSAPT